MASWSPLNESKPKYCFSGSVRLTSLVINGLGFTDVRLLAFTVGFVSGRHCVREEFYIPMPSVHSPIAQLACSCRPDLSSCSLAYCKVTSKLFTFLDGTSNMASIITASTMERNPRAPNLYSTALSTM